MGTYLCRLREQFTRAFQEAWGLVDGQPTSVHFMVRVYDDIITRESVTTPEQINKVTSAWELKISGCLQKKSLLFRWQSCRPGISACQKRMDCTATGLTWTR